MSVVALTMTGDLQSRSALPWICHRARLLSLTGWVRRESESEIDIVLSGPDPLIDAMEVACSLGPADILVEDITRRDHRLETEPNGFVIAR